MRTDRSESEYAEIKELLLETKKAVEETKKYARTTRNYVRWLQIAGILKLLVIAVPITLAIIFLPTLIKQAASTYGQFLGGSGSGNIIQQFLKSQNISPDILQKAGISDKQVQDALKTLQQKR